jgi:hypothetical protein
MTIVIDDNLLAIWWMAIPSRLRPDTNESDLLCSLVRRSPEECELIWRFRYYETKGAWDGLDRKNWYQGVVKDPPEEIIATLRVLLKAMSEKAGGNQVYEIVRGDMSTKEFTERFMKMPFVHVKDPKEAEEWERERHQRQPQRAPLPVHYVPSGSNVSACPVEIIGTNVTSKPVDVTCKRCAKHRDVIEYRNSSRVDRKPPHA